MHYVVGGVGGCFVVLGPKEGHVHPAYLPHQITFRAFRAA